MKSTKEDVKDRLKEYKSKGQAPEFMTWMSLQTLEGGYLIGNESPKQLYQRLARAAASYTPKKKRAHFKDRFFDIMWRGWLAPSTPVAANLGTDRGMAVSCSGNYVADSVDSIYGSVHEQALLTKNGFGTSSYMGDIRARGDEISTGGHSSGLWPWIEEHRDMTQVVSQGNTRRGSWAGYFPIDHGDFYELMNALKTTDRLNLGVCVSDEFTEKLKNRDKEALKRYQVLLETRMTTGKPYIFFNDRVNRLSPECYKDKEVHASNLCTEITLHSSEKYTYTCVLSSMNLELFDEWEKTDAVFIATIFLDCVAEDFIQRGSKVRGLEKAVRFTKAGRALGLGALGYHSYLQNNMIPYDSLDSMFTTQKIFAIMKAEATRASEWMAEEWGESEWTKGYGVRNTHLMALAPNVSSSIICASTSPSALPWDANVTIQKTAKGKFMRINPAFIKLLKSKGKYTDEIISEVALNKGSCQDLNFLTDIEKDVFKTAYEINQKSLIRLAERRQRYIDQAQSINLFFAANENPQWIHEVHKLAFESEWIKSLYYVRTQAGIQADKGDDCKACEG